MGFYDAFFGSDQSQYTAYAIITAIIVICITILLNATDIPISNRLLIVFFVIISLIPSVFLTLFQLTCIVTGGTEPNKWWCYAFAWILAIFIIIYCIFIVIISLISLFNYKKTIDNLNETKNKKLIEKFYDNSEEEENNTSFEIAATVSPEYPPETASPIYDNENF
jgi:magnesium-transporting ATPase (P-type)